MNHVGPQTPFSESLHAQKYRGPGESFREYANRVAGVLAAGPHFKPFRDVLLHQHYLPGGRIQTAVGSTRETTPYNCYVSGTIEDSLTAGQGSIMERAAQAARTMQMGGGIGYDFSTLRPRGASIKKLGSRSSGPISFMGIFNALCLTIASAGHRRGAQMGVMRIDHPDIEEFIRAKHDSVSLTGFNVSIAVTDEFMEAVEGDNYFDLRWGGEVYRTVRARDLWEMVMRSTWDWAEPGVLFIDRINQRNPLYYCETIAATNPCFTGDTRVWTAERGHVPFRDLVGETLHVLTQTEDGRLAYRPMSNIRVTRRDAQLVKVALDNGKEIRCTPSHEFFLRDGRVVAAKDLAQGDSLCSVYRYRANSKGYMRLSNGVSAPLEHHVPFEDVAGLGSSVHAHHLNGVKHDNRPSNLRLMYAADHMRHHMEGDENPLRRMPDRNPMFLDPDCTRGEKNGRWRQDLCTEAMIEMREAGFSYRDIGKQFGCSPYTARKRILDANHRVVSVEFLDEREDVYCGTVDDGAHRFFVALGDHDGVLVANCGEQPLPPFGACLLGSFNLVKYLRWVGDNWVFDHSAFRRDIPLVVAAMDRVVDVARYPLFEQEKEAQSKRRMGLGVTGLANTIEACGYPYGSAGFILCEEEIMRTLRDEAYRASAMLADERGAFPMFNADRYLSGPFAQELPEDVRELIRHHGLRNSHLLSIAPTGTISLTADNVSSGIEPVFSYAADRTIQEFDGPVSYHVEDYGAKFLGVRGKTADRITADEHVGVLCAAQKYVDSSVSKTCNVSPDMEWEEFKELYMRAWRGGAKGCTTFNPGGKRMGILQAKSEDPEPAACRIDPETGRGTCE